MIQGPRVGQVLAQVQFQEAKTGQQKVQFQQNPPPGCTMTRSSEFRSLDLVSRIRIRLDPNYFVRFVYESVTRIRAQPLVCTEHRHQTDKENPKRLVCITTL